MPWVPPDTLVYNSDNIFPGRFIKIAGEGIMDGARIVTVEVCPHQYRPKTKRLFLVRSIGARNSLAIDTNGNPGKEWDKECKPGF
uniref:Gingipain propeptide domain-containing protein n=1 Tax=candidate division WOR-3 bacterium TaxID=2052148 RepID=A0A7V1EIM8_UNCW3